MSIELVSLKLLEKSKDDYNSEQYEKVSQIVQTANLIMLTLSMAEFALDKGEDGHLSEYPGGEERFRKELEIMKSKDKIKILEMALSANLPKDNTSLPLPREILVKIGAMAMSQGVELIESSGFNSGTKIEDIL